MRLRQLWQKRPWISDEVRNLVVIEDRLAAGWRPAKTVERLWIRGGAPVFRGADGDLVDESWDDCETMTDAEESALVEHRWSSGG